MADVVIAINKTTCKYAINCVDLCLGVENLN